MRLRPKIIAGFECVIDVSDGGEFKVLTREPERALAHAKTLDEAVAGAKKALTKNKLSVAIPFYTMEGERGEATGRHAGTGEILARIDGKTVQLRDDWMRPGYLSGDTPAATIAEYARLQEQSAELYRRKQEIEREHSLLLGKAVNAALEEAYVAGGGQ